MSDSNDTHPLISTKHELLMRLRERSVPDCEATLDLDSGVGTDVRRKGETERLFRIARLGGSLDSAHDRLDKQQAFARLGGYAKAGFEIKRQ